MEFEDVREKAAWEARRVAAAFGVSQWERYLGQLSVFWGLNPAEKSITWALDFAGRLEYLCIEGDVVLTQEPLGYWDLYEREEFEDILARGLYCLGIEDDTVFDELPPLTFHEKMELRLSLPREFWPKTWLDEEDTITQPLHSQ